MTKRVLVGVAMMAMSFSIFGQPREAFNSIVDFDTTIRELAIAAAKEDVEALPNRLVLIDGTVASRLVVDANRESYVAQLELIGGEWIGVEEVVAYRCYVLLDGPEFANAVPARRSRNKHPDEIDANSRVLVVGSLIGISEAPDGSLVAVLDAYHIRKMS